MCYNPSGDLRMNNVLPGTYRHYKGNDYLVIAVARHSETEEEMVVYRCLYGDRSLWVRPISMFSDMVELEGKPVLRFTRLDREPEDACP